MTNRDAQYYEWLLPYLEGGLDEARRAQIEARLAADPALAAEAERLRRTLAGLRGAASRTSAPANAQVPADLWPRLRARLAQESPVSTPRPRAQNWWLAGVGATAAASVLLAVVWLPGWHARELSESPHTRPVLLKAAPAAPNAPVSAPSTAAKVPAPPTAKPLVKTQTRPVVQPKAAPKSPPTTPVVTQANPFALPVAPTSPGHASIRRAVPPAAAPALPVKINDQTTASRSMVAAPSAPAPTPAVTPAPPPPAPAPMPPPPPPPPPPPVVRLARPPLEQNGPGMTGSLSGGAAPQIKPPSALFPNPAPPFRQPLHGAARNKAAERDAATQALGGALEAFAAAAPAKLDAWQATLAAAVQPPLWGETTGEQQANQALMAAREAGMLDDLRARLEARRTQTPHDVVTGRMLAAVYDFGFSSEMALRERRRVAGLNGADGEDWFALAQSEERAGNGTSARAAYRRALESAVPPPSFHAAIARQRS